jgi:hypothetical protein
LAAAVAGPRLTTSALLPACTARIVGALGGPDGVKGALVALDGDAPFELLAVTLKLYETPFVSPGITMGDVMEVAEIPPG